MVDLLRALDFTKEEAFDLGVIEGQKQALQEILNIGDADGKYILAYVNARLTGINNSIEFISKHRIKRELSNE